MTAKRLARIPSTIRGLLTGSSIALGLTAVTFVAASSANAANVTWTGATNGAWDTTTGNWSGGSPTSILYNDTTPDAVLFDDTVLNANTTISLAPGLAPASVTVNNSTNNYIFQANGFGGSGSLTKQGAGMLTLSTANSYSGGTMLSGGTLSFANGSLGTTGAISMSGGTLQWNGSNTQDVSSRITMVNSTTATFDTNGNSFTFAAAIGNSTSASLTKTGAGTLTLSGANTYTGGTTVNGGILALAGNNGPAGRITGTLTINSGGEVQLGGNNWALGYDNAGYVNTITINGGTLNQMSGGGTSAHTINMTGGVIKGTAIDYYNLAPQSAQNIAFNTFASATTATVSAGMALRMNNGGTTGGTMTFTVASGTTSSGTDLLISGNITVPSGASTQRLAKAGAGTMQLTGTNTYGGGTTITAGTLDAGSLGALGSGAVNISGGTLSTSVANVNSGALTLNNAASVLNLNGTAAGTITLSANASLLMSAGTWHIDIATAADTIARAASGTGTFSITGGTLDLGGGSIDYTSSYNLISGFSSGSVSGLNITDYDNTNWSASLSNTGLLAFTSVPEPGAWMSLLGGCGVLLGLRRRRAA